MRSENIKAAVFDIDDTLFDMRSKQFVPSAIEALKRLQAAGILVILATGRPPLTAGAIRQEGILPDYTVCTNGHLILDAEGKVLQEHTFDRALVDEVYRYCLEHQIGLLWKYPDRTYEYIPAVVFENFYSKTKDSRKNVVKGQTDIHLLRNPNGGCLGCDESKRIQFNAAFKGRCIAVRIDDASSDLMIYGIHKKYGVETVLKHLGISPEQCIAFGDNKNDMEILQYAGIGICMGNGSEDLKAIADYVTDDLCEDGIKNALEHLNILDRSALKG
jgi:Cof subfamily protein (haloacid dehalogenase superfamily)